MLISLTRVGAARQAVAKGVVVAGADPRHVLRSLDPDALPRLGGVPLTVVPQERAPGLLLVRTPLAWLGGPQARDEAFAALGRATSLLVSAARAAGARLLPTSVTLGDAPAVLGGDLHELEVLDATEQEVLCNALRRHVPALIALAGRGVVGPGLPRDRVGSRWLVDSAEHLATRYLASTSPGHLAHVQADLRRGGVARLDQMDVAPVVHDDGTRTVLVRCLDAQASLAVTRAHAVLLCALAVHARRLVRSGRREGNVPQRLLEENRARAVAEGARASLGTDAARAGRAAPQNGRRPADRRNNDQRGDRRDDQRGDRREDDRRAEERPVRQAGALCRELLVERRADLTNVDASVEELAPLLAALDLPGLGVPFRRSDDIVRRWAAEGPAGFEARLLASLCDGRAGGPVMAELRAAHPGKVGLILESWRTTLAQGDAPPRGKRPGGGKGGKSGNRSGGNRQGGRNRQGGGGNRRSGDPGQGGGNRQAENRQADNRQGGNRPGGNRGGNRGGRPGGPGSGRGQGGDRG